jgi:hypothetical protein
MNLITRRSSLAPLIKLTTDTLAVSVDVSLVKLEQVETKPAKVRLVKGLSKGGFIESKVAFKGDKVRQMPGKTVQSLFGSTL